MNHPTKPHSWRSGTLSTLKLLFLPVVAAIPLGAAAQTITISNLWSISTAEARPYLTNTSATSYSERGVAYNPLNNHAYIVSRAGGVKVGIVDGDTGAEIGYLDVTGITGGTFPLSTIGVAEDGAIYAANLTTGSASSPYKIYRWADESSLPAVVYSGNPSVDANNNRYGESFDVRGSGINTEIIASANAAAIVAIFRPIDETLSTFTSSRIDVAGIGAGDLTKGIAFGPTNTFFGKNNGSVNARHCLYDTTLGTATVLASFSILSGIAPIDTDNANNLLAGVETANATSPHNLRVYDLSSGSAVLIHTSAFPAPAANNGNLVGQVQINGDRIFAIDTQNGVQMAKILVDTSVAPPVLTGQPASQTVQLGGYTTLSAAATGTRPLFYQWSFNGTPIPGAITNTLSLTNVTEADGGNYVVTVSNAAGSTNSEPAVITINSTPLNDSMRVLWKLAPGSRPYLTSDNTQRGLAYNPISGNVLLVSRAPGTGIQVLDGETGEFKYAMNLGSGTIVGGTFTLNMIACTEDGQVFACNLTTDGSGANKFRVYGWLDDGEFEAPYLAWEGDPGDGTAHRWGDNFDARGAGPDVEILAGSRNGTVVSIIRPSFGVNSAPSVINVAGAEPGNFGLSVKWGNGFTFYGKSAGGTLRHCDYDPSTLEGNTIAVNDSYPNVNVIGFDPASGLIAAISREIPDNLRLLNGNILPAGNITLDTEFFLTDNDNANGTGQIAMGNRRIYALQSNNGIIAVSVGPTLRMAKFENSLILTWLGEGILQGTPSLDEPFEDITGATSGYTVDLGSTAGNRFFRLKE